MKYTISTHTLLIASILMVSSQVEAREEVTTGISVKELRTKFAKSTKAGPELESPGAKDARVTISAARGKATTPAATATETTRAPIETGATESVASLRSKFEGRIKAEPQLESPGAKDARAIINAASVSVKDRAQAWGRQATAAPARAPINTGADEYTPSVRERAATWGKQPTNVPTEDLLGLDEPAPKQPLKYQADMDQLAEGMQAEARLKGNEEAVARKAAIKAARDAEREARIATQKAAGDAMRAKRAAENAEEAAAQTEGRWQINLPKGKIPLTAPAAEEQSVTGPQAPAATYKTVKTPRHKQTTYERKEKMKRTNQTGGHGGKKNKS